MTPDDGPDASTADSLSVLSVFCGFTRIASGEGHPWQLAELSFASGLGNGHLQPANMSPDQTAAWLRSRTAQPPDRTLTTQSGSSTRDQRSDTT